MSTDNRARVARKQAKRLGLRMVQRYCLRALRRERDNAGGKLPATYVVRACGQARASGRSRALWGRAPFERVVYTMK